jgi:lipase maturation factor 1
MRFSPAAALQWLFVGDRAQSPGRLAPRWLFLRALGLIFFSAFYSLLFQVRGLIGPDGLLPAGSYLQSVAREAGVSRYWYAPTLFWLGSDSRALLLVVWLGIAASVLLALNVWPRAMLFACLAAYLSFIAALQTFSSYQSDGMLLEAGFIGLFFAPEGLRPGWGEDHPPSRASLFLLQWLWFRIYFESGVAKISSGDLEWRNLTAMIDYYQNGPLPTWMAWYAQHLPRWFHVGTAGMTLVLELALVWAFILPRRFRVALFCIVTPWELGIILTSNYAFLNYIVLALGVLLLDDGHLARVLPRRLRKAGETDPGFVMATVMATVTATATATVAATTTAAAAVTVVVPEALPPAESATSAASPPAHRDPVVARGLAAARIGVPLFFLGWIFYATTVLLVWMIVPELPLPSTPIVMLEPFRVANRFGLFAVMTRGRYEIEFQGSNDGVNWTAYPFRYKPQDPRAAPRVFAPYQPRFDWNLWFASLESWRQNPFVVSAEERLLTNSPPVLALFAGNPFPDAAPRMVRAVVWQYWFTDSPQKAEGLWWRREALGLYAPALARSADGKFGIVAMPAPDQRPRE